jgi:hypothetical protein
MPRFPWRLLTVPIGLGLAACASDAFDPTSVDLLGTWNAAVAVDYTAPDNSVHHCQAAWTQDVTTFQGSHDTLEAIAPTPILLKCGPGLSPAWPAVGQGFLWVRNGAHVRILKLNNSELLATVTLLAKARLSGPLEPSFAGTSPLILTR